MTRGCAAGLAGLLLVLAFASAASAAEPTTWSFGYTGGPQEFTVPAGVTELSMIAFGGAGAAAQEGGPGPGAPGGAGGGTYGRFAVTPGEELTVWVGDEGHANENGQGNAWGYGCGGEGLDAEHSPKKEAGAGGGGASAVTVGPDSTPAGECFTPRPEGADLLVVAGGGGGGGNEYPELFEDFDGGAGGDGGRPAGKGHEGRSPKGRHTDNGGCGGCQSGPTGEDSEFDISHLNGGGGGGGGYRGGGSGQGTSSDAAAGGGGGGLSYVAQGAHRAAFLPGPGTGSGSVVLTALQTQDFGCTENPQTVHVPEGTGRMEVEALGAHGGDEGPNSSVSGGLGGAVTGTFEVGPAEAVTVSVGCRADGSAGGWGYGHGGEGGGRSVGGEQGGGGGGSSAVVNGSEVLLALAAGGGGGGGDGNDEHVGAGGGDGGSPPENGGNGDEGAGGGRGGAVSGFDGGDGASPPVAASAGGGGGGGAGWSSGEGGRAGTDAGSGAGAGGGLSYISSSVVAGSSTYGKSPLPESGDVSLTFLPLEATAVTTYGGSKQSAELAGEFPRPLEALVVDASGRGVPGARVTFRLPTSGAGGVFSGATRTETVMADSDGIAVSRRIIANTLGGPWEATASIASSTTPARFALTNEATPTTTTIVASDDPATPTEPVTFTATVTPREAAPGAPTGKVQFFVDGDALGAPVALSGERATSIPDTGLVPGDHRIEAFYEGNATFARSGGSTRLPVERTPTATGLTASKNPALPEEAVTLTARVSVPPGNGAYAGAVQFLREGEQLGLPVSTVGGVATSAPIRERVAREYTFTALATESTDFAGSEGVVVVNVATEGVALEVEPDELPVEWGSSFDLGATVVPQGAGPTPGGTVSFTAGGGACEGTLVAASTECEPTPPPRPGGDEIEALYSGDLQYDRTGGKGVEQVTKAKSATSSGARPLTSVYGEDVTLDAEVGRLDPGAGTPSGTVAFTLDGSAIGSPVALASGHAESAAVVPNAGAHTVTAEYEGDSFFKASTGPAPYLIGPAPVEVALEPSAAPSQPGGPLSFTAKVKATDATPAEGVEPTPTGSVQFRVDGLDLGDPVAMQAGRATSPVDEELASGSHRVVAIYLPDSGNFLGASADLVQIVAQPTTIVLAASANPVAPHAPVTIEAHVGPTATAGAVDFTLDGAPVASCQALPVVEGMASCTLTGLAAGGHEVGATYSGSSLLDPSQGHLSVKVEAESPPAACSVRALRGRVLVLPGRNAIRFVGRYLDGPTAKVRLLLFTRTHRGRAGRRLAAVSRTWRAGARVRVDFKVRRRLAARMRKGKHRFVLRYVAGGEPGWCGGAFEQTLSRRRNRFLNQMPSSNQRRQGGATHES